MKKRIIQLSADDMAKIQESDKSDVELADEFNTTPKVVKLVKLLPKKKPRAEKDEARIHQRNLAIRKRQEILKKKAHAKSEANAAKVNKKAK